MINDNDNCEENVNGEITEPFGLGPGDNFVNDGRVYILGMFDASISREVIPGVIDIIEKNKNSKDPKIEIYINSFGGYGYQLWALISILSKAKKLGFKIITHNIGVACSCGSLLAVFGDHRTMSEYADNVAHLGCIGYDAKTMKQLDRQNDFAKSVFNKILDFYARYTKAPRKKLEELLSDDHLHLSPKQCLKLGFCDEID